MKTEEWKDFFIRLCRVYQKSFKALENISAEYYKNSNDNLTKLGQIQKFEGDLLLEYLKEKKVKPDYGSIPQYYQLLEIYENHILKEKIYNEFLEMTEVEDCNLCDNTGFVPMYDLAKDSEFVCGCKCKKGKQIIENAKKRESEYKVFIMPYERIKNNKQFILRDNVDDSIRILSKEHVITQNKKLFSEGKIKENKKQVQIILEKLKNGF